MEDGINLRHEGWMRPKHTFGFVKKEPSSTTLLAEVTTNRKSVLRVKSLTETDARSLNGWQV